MPLFWRRNTECPLTFASLLRLMLCGRLGDSNTLQLSHLTLSWGDMDSRTVALRTIEQRARAAALQLKQEEQAAQKAQREKARQERKEGGDKSESEDEDSDSLEDIEGEYGKHLRAERRKEQAKLSVEEKEQVKERVQEELERQRVEMDAGKGKKEPATAVFNRIIPSRLAEPVYAARFAAAHRANLGGFVGHAGVLGGEAVAKLCEVHSFPRPLFACVLFGSLSVSVSGTPFFDPCFVFLVERIVDCHQVCYRLAAGPGGVPRRPAGVRGEARPARV
jgi:hypothetical protein